jgi:hypothetical protein
MTWQPTVFVSGHLDLTQAEFEEHYILKLRECLSQGMPFVVGDAPGCDTMTQVWLRENHATVTVYHMLEAPRNHNGFPCKGGYYTDEARDAAMTWCSDVDVAWVRPGREKSGTARNLARRRTTSTR